MMIVINGISLDPCEPSSPKLFPALVEISTRFVTARQSSECRGGEIATESFPDVGFFDVIRSLAIQVAMSTRSGEKRQKKITSVSGKHRESDSGKSAVGCFASRNWDACTPRFTYMRRVCSKFPRCLPTGRWLCAPAFFSEVTSR